MSRSGCGWLVLLSALAVVIFPFGSVSGQGWSGPVMISSGVRSAEFPQVAMGPEGRAVAAFTEWSEIVEGMEYVQQSFANVFDGSNWGTAQRIDVDNDAWESDDPVVAMDASGNACAAFVELTSAWHVYFNYWDGSAWAGPSAVDETLGHQTDWPEVAMDGSGNAMAAFRVYDTYETIFAGYWNGSAWTLPQRISPVGATTNADSPGIAMDKTGSAVAVFRLYGSPNRIYANHWNGST